MESISMLAALAVAWSIIVVSPGPCFLTVVQCVIRGSRRDGVLCALGIACGSLVWCLGSGLGLAMLLSAWSWLADVIRAVGVVYLAWLGVTTLISAARARATAGPGGPPISSTAEPIPVAGPRSAWKVIRTGLVIDLSNPKAAAFFTSLFATFVPHDAPVWLWAVTIAEVIAIEFTWYVVVAFLFSLGSVGDTYRRAKRGIDIAVGVVFLLLAGKLALDR